jgi:hypothetical protein
VIPKGWLLLLPAAGVILCQGGIDRSMGGFRAQEEILYVWSGEHVRRMLPGFESLMSDIYWIRMVQYYGGQRVFARDKRYDLLEPLARITTTLDPKFDIAYRYAATFLSESPPGGAGKPEAGVALLKEGVRQNPDNWILWQNLGYFQFVFLHDARAAAESLTEGARHPGAPHWLATLAAELLRQGGERAAARRIWQSLYDSAEAEAIQQLARKNLLRLDALDRVDDLGRAVASFRERHHRNPLGWRELRAEGLLAERPGDPLGCPLEYDPALGQFWIARASPLWSVSVARGER